MTTLPELVAAQTARTPDAIAVCCGQERLTYRELGERANVLARRLHAHGAGPDRLVGVCLRRTIDLPVVLLAVLQAGAAYLPLDPNHPPARLRALLEDARPAVVIGNDRSVDLGVAALYTDDPGEEPPALPPVELRPENLAYVLYTSGSTGTPRAIAVEHRAVVNLVQAGSYVHFGPEEVFLQAAPLAFDASTFEIWGALTNGATLALLPGDYPEPALLAEVVQRERVSTLWLTAGLFHQLAEDGLAALRPVRQLVVGGDVLAPGAVRRALTALPHCRISNGYGPTETTTFATAHPITAPDCSGAIPIGRPIHGVHAYVLDDQLRPAETGELYLAGAGLARGYRDRPAETASRFLPDPFAGPGERMYRTGDRARLRPDGVLEFLGRRDHQVKLRGFRIEPAEIEHRLRAHPQVGDAVVVLRENRLVGYVTATGDTDPAALRAYLAEGLPDFMVPAALLVLPCFPLTANGKTDRTRLPQPPAPTPAGRSTGTAAEELLAGALAAVLGVEQVDIDGRLFALGVDSLQVMRWLGRVNAAIGARLTVREAFTAGTVAALAAQLSTSDHDVESPVTRTEAPPKPSGAQEQLWLLDQLHPGSSGYGVPLLFELRGPLSADALDAALTALAQRHEPLRTVYPAIDGRPAARLLPTGFPLVRTTLSTMLTEQARTGFDLEHGPVARALLIELGPDEHILAITVHHIACDGWSMAVLRRELGACYRAFVRGADPGLPELAVRYRDVVHWQRNRLAATDLGPALRYWRETLAGAETLQLPTAPRRAIARHRGAARAFTISAESAAALRGLARDRDATVFMVLLTTFQVLLARYSGQTDICVATPTAGRDRPEFEGLIGYFVNLLVARGDLSGDPSFATLLARTRTATLDAFAHRELPFAQLVEHLGIERVPGRNPIAQVAFAWHNSPPGELDLPGVEVRRLDPEITGAKFDLTLSIEAGDTDLRGTLEYDTDLFTADAMDRLIGHLNTLLNGIVTTPGARISELPLLTPAELGHRQQANLPAQAPNPARGAGAPTVPELVAHWVRHTPDAVAISCAGQHLTYAQLDRRATELAQRLCAGGAGPERVVGVCLRRGLDLPVALLAVLKAGAAYLPLEPDYPLAHQQFLIEDAAPVLIVGTPDTASRLSSTGIPVLDVEGPSVRPVPLPRVWPDTLAYVMYTSGSTGTPKGVAVPHRGIVRLATDESAYRMRGEVLAQLAPFAFDAATFEIWGALANGGRLAVLPPGHNPIDDFGGFVSAEGVTTCFLTTALFHEIVTADPAQLGGLRQVLFGGEVMPAAVARTALAALPGVRLVHVYGPTETVTFCAAQPLDPAHPPTGLIPIGGPLAGGPLHVLDGAGQPVPVGVPGELHVEGIALSRGYLNRPGLTAERFVPSPFGRGARLYRTGDLVRRRVDGALEFLGRRDGQVKIRGFRIETGEIEAVLRGHDTVHDAVVTVLGDDPATRRLVATVSGHPAADLRGYLAQRLPGHLVPDRISTVPGLPMSLTGKVDRQAIAAAEARQRDDGEPAAIGDATTAQIARIWQDVLGCGPVGARANFFDLGGNSLLVARVRARIRDRFQRDVALVELFRYPTVAELADYLRHGAQPATTVSTVDVTRLGTGLDRMAGMRARRTRPAADSVRGG